MIETGVFILLVSSLLWADINIHGKSCTITTKSAALWTLLYIAASLTFALYLGVWKGEDYAILFLTGWGLEKILAFDNLMVFIAIFSYFGIELKYQHRILHLGILGAIVLRLIFVSVGIGAMDIMGSWAEIVFGLIILYTAYLMYTHGDDEPVDYEKAWYIRLTQRWLPVTDRMNGSDLFYMGMATPAFFALVAIEISDIIFAFDSVPAILAVTRDPFIAYTAIIFAVLGLRSMYFLIFALSKQFQYLESAVIVVLVFIACKLFLNALTGIDISPILNLSIVLCILVSGVVISILREGSRC